GTGTLIQSGPGPLTLSDTNTFTGGMLITNGSTLAVSGAGSLGAAGTSNNYIGNITNFGTFNYASSAAETFSGIVTGTGALNETGPGELTLSGTDSYTGATSISSNATLALASSGSINNTASINLAAGGTFDVSAFGLSYSLGGSTTLRPAGTGTNAGSAAATIVGSSGGTINVGSLVLTFKPQAFSGDATHPVLYVSSGALNLSGSGLTVSNAAATPLGAGTYNLIQVASQNLSVAGTNVTVTGTGLAAGAAASLAVNGGNLNLVVVNTSVPVPVINSVVVSGNCLIFSGTNGPNNQTYEVITSTNLSTPLHLWTPIQTNSFSGTGTFSVTNSIATTNQLFFGIKIH
ncbi:MAG TPA: autotransporter-associated beta strand repeat-containing protein, partial [Verrucomicrobiae bacterium]|nr:autotransporter-associated beta strand repeat-containing protein [Verrucomicrobiae bacterium]